MKGPLKTEARHTPGWPKRTPRQEFELRAMQHFNAARQFWSHHVDAGELGILHLTNNGTEWRREWIELEQIPARARAKEQGS